jgi:hypothetical protein
VLLAEIEVVPASELGATPTMARDAGAP